jgi:hypothetical protein
MRCHPACVSIHARGRSEQGWLDPTPQVGEQSRIRQPCNPAIAQDTTSPRMRPATDSGSRSVPEWFVPGRPNELQRVLAARTQVSGEDELGSTAREHPDGAERAAHLAVWAGDGRSVSLSVHRAELRDPGIGEVVGHHLRLRYGVVLGRKAISPAKHLIGPPAQQARRANPASQRGALDLMMISMTTTTVAAMDHGVERLNARSGRSGGASRILHSCAVRHRSLPRRQERVSAGPAHPLVGSRSGTG